jgi:hypothetical protein
MPFWRCAAQTRDDVSVAVAADTYGRSGWASALNMCAHARIRCYRNGCPRVPCRAVLRRLDERLRRPLTFLHFSPNSPIQFGKPLVSQQQTTMLHAGGKKGAEKKAKGCVSTARVCMHYACVGMHFACFISTCVYGIRMPCTMQKHVLHACGNIRKHMHAGSQAGLQACVQIEWSPTEWSPIRRTYS